MSDFDDVLERLVTDPGFAAALAADPAAALAGYRLEPDEIELLRSQVSADTGGQTAVEVRANQSSLFGMLSPIVGAVGGLPGIGDPLPGTRPAPEPTVPTPLTLAGDGIGAPAHREGFGAPPGQAGFGAAYHEGFGPSSPDGVAGGGGQAGFGAAPSHGGGAGGPAPVAGFGPAPSGHDAGGGAIGAGFDGAAPGDGASAPQAGFGAAQAGAGFGAPQARAGFGAAPGGGIAGLGDAIGERLQGAEPSADTGWLAPPEGYRTDVDMDGDGATDEFILRGRRDGGVDILVDSNRDGRVDIIGHDADADGLIESADYDKNRDGTFEKHMYDDDGDGWLDRTVIDRRPRP